MEEEKNKSVKGLSIFPIKDFIEKELKFKIVNILSTDGNRLIMNKYKGRWRRVVES